MAFLLVATMGCASSLHAVAPGLQIVLTAQQGVFLAPWRGGDLEPRLLTEFKQTVLYTGATDAAGDVIAVVGRASETGRSAFYFIDPRQGTYQKVFEADTGRYIYALAIAPGKQALGFVSHHSAEGSRDVVLFDLRDQRRRILVQGRAFVALSWKPDGEHLAYDTRDGWVESVTLKTERIERLVQGGDPAWSPDGTKLAYHRNGRFFLYDPARGTSQEFPPPSEPLPISGRLHWSPDGRYISTNAERNYLGLLTERCVVIEMVTGQRFVVHCDGLASGPWLVKQ